MAASTHGSLKAMGLANMLYESAKRLVEGVFWSGKAQTSSSTEE